MTGIALASSSGHASALGGLAGPCRHENPSPLQPPSVHVGATPLGGAALTHGFGIAFYVLAGVAAFGALLAAVLVESNPVAPEVEVVDGEVVQVELAA